MIVVLVVCTVNLLGLHHHPAAFWLLGSWMPTIYQQLALAASGKLLLPSNHEPSNSVKHLSRCCCLGVLRYKKEKGFPWTPSKEKEARQASLARCSS